MSSGSGGDLEEYKRRSKKNISSIHNMRTQKQATVRKEAEKKIKVVAFQTKTKLQPPTFDWNLDLIY